MMANPDPNYGGYVVLAVIIVLVVSWLYRQWRPRFVIDENGERQRVDHWNRGQPVYDPKTWQQRVFEEAKTRSKRRLILLGSLALVIGPLYVWNQATTEQSFWLGALGGVLVLYIALPLGLFVFVPQLVLELLYQSGYQGMKGAKVLDQKPKPPPGRELVETQKAHGDARLASEAEALSLLNSKN